MSHRKHAISRKARRAAVRQTEPQFNFTMAGIDFHGLTGEEIDEVRRYLYCEVCGKLMTIRFKDCQICPECAPAPEIQTYDPAIHGPLHVTIVPE